MVAYGEQPRYWPKQPTGPRYDGLGAWAFAMRLYAILQARGVAPLACFVEGGAFIEPLSADASKGRGGTRQHGQHNARPKVPRKGPPRKRRRSPRNVMKAPPGLKFSKV